MKRALLWLLLVSGCAGGTTGKPLHTFPSRAELTQIAKSSEAKKTVEADFAALDQWQLDMAGPQAANPGYPFLARVAPNARPSAPLDCVAHELARVVVTTGKRPGASLLRFVAARCGASIAAPESMYWTLQNAENTSEQAAYDTLGKQLDRASTLAGKQAGIGFARAGGKVAVAIAHGSATVELDGLQQVVGADGKLVIRGRVLEDIVALQPVINFGEYGYRECEIDLAVALPKFAISCTLADTDDYAWMQLMTLSRGRVLANEALGIHALRSPDAGKTYSSRKLGAARPVTDATSFRAAVLDVLNPIRRAAGQQPLTAAPEQSDIASSVAPVFFRALQNDEGTATSMIDAISLGLLAGWEVHGGVIRNGDLVAGLVVETLDAERWLSDVIERPIGRAVLLDPDSRVLALGAAVQRDPGLLGAVALTYSFFEEEPTPGALAMQVLERLGRVRKARNLGGTSLVSDAPGMPEQLQRIKQNQATPSEALQEALQAVSGEFNSAELHGFVWEAQDLDSIEFPPELLVRGDLMLAAGATFYKAEGAAWGQYTVLFVVIGVANKETIAAPTVPTKPTDTRTALRLKAPMRVPLRAASRPS
jgi:hypothetical protein